MRGCLHLSHQTRAELFESLWRLSDAGMAPERMLTTAAASFEQPVRGALIRAAVLVRGGTPLSGAGARSGLLSSRDERLLRVGEQGGNVEAILRRLADHYRRRTSRLRRLKAKMMYPVIILILAIFVLPVPLVFQGAIGPGGYLLRTVIPLGLLAGCVAWWGPVWRRVAGGRSALSGILLNVPVVSRLVVQQARTDMLESLGLFLTSGVAADSALQASLSSVGNHRLRLRFANAGRALEKGSTVAEALHEVELLSASEGLPLVSAGEQAGRLDELVSRYAQTEAERLEERYDLVATWLPRIAYFVVIAVVGGGLLS